MKTNLLNIALVKKGFLPSALLCLVALSLRAQSVMMVSPPETALAGSVMGRTESAWYARANPASLPGAGEATMSASYSPSSIGIAGYHEGALVAALPLDSAWCVGISAQATGIAGYREVSGTALGAVTVERTVTLGVAFTYNSLAIDRYGSASAVTVDLGAIAHLNDRIRFGMAMKNLLRATLAGQDQPQRVSVGFAFDLGDRTVMSVDAMQEIGRSAAASFGMSYMPVAGLTLRGGAATNPAMISLGAGYDLGGILIDYGVAYVQPLGFRHVVGAGVRW